jgi:hypothetical protein
VLLLFSIFAAWGEF